jgi:hypothetical protein
MNAIQFPRAAIHQRSLLQAARASNDWFPPMEEKSREFCKNSADANAPTESESASRSDRKSRRSEPQRSQPAKVDLLQA